MGLKHGIFGWADLASPDIEASKTFYSAVLGWDTVDEPNGMPYTFFQVGGKTVAGMGHLTEEAQKAGQIPVWSSYVIVDDAAATLARATELGAQPVMDVMDVGDTGRMAFFFDPHGAAVGLWESGTHDGADVFNVTGAMTWNELNCRDVEAAKAFYSELFGWESETNQFGEMEYTVISNAGRVNGGMMDITELAPEHVPSHWAVYFIVDDCDAAAKAATDNGGSLFMGPMDSEAGRMAGIVDPTGAMFTAIQPTNVDDQPER